MSSDERQPAWQAGAPQAGVTVDAETLRQHVLRDQQEFQTLVHWQGAGEVAASLLLVPVWLILGALTSPPWTWYLAVPAFVWTAAFGLVYRKRHPLKLSQSDESLEQCVTNSLKHVELQSWVLRNSFWWYLLPSGIAVLVFFAHVSWQSAVASNDWLKGLGFAAFLFVIFWVIFSSVRRLMQRTTNAQIEPRRQQLLTLLTSLREATAGDLTGGQITVPALPFAEEKLPTPSCSPVRAVLGLLAFTVIMVFVMGMIAVIRDGAGVLPGAAVAPLGEPEFDDVSAFGGTDVARVDAWLQQQVERAKYPSLSVAVVRNGEIVYQRAGGFEDIKAGRKATPQSVYNVASVTKAFTATLAVILHDRGVVDLDQPAIKYLPEGVSISTTPDVGATITLRQLASHTSGLPRGVPGRVQSVEGWYQLEPQRLYDHLANIELNCVPGTNEEYSNLGFGLLGHALECAAAQPLDRMLKEMICDPLQLRHTAIQVDDTLHPATGYDGSSWRFEKRHSFRERLAGSGGLVSSVEDLAKFLAAQMEPGVFSAEMLSQLHTRSTLTDGLRAGTALGWTSRRNFFVGRILEKNGGRSNCSAWIGFSPEHRVGVAVVTNCGGPDVDEIGSWLLERSVPGAHQPLTKFGHYALVAPYSDVRWKDGKPIVRVGDEWSPLVSIDGIPIDRIMEFAQQEFGDKARKRFAEDVVELLTKLGHEPQWEVTLGLQKNGGQVQHLQVRMTKENRNLLRK